MSTRRTLTDDQARWALKEIQSGRMTQSLVARELSTTPQVISALVSGRTYRHLHGLARSDRVSDGGVRHGLLEVPERRYCREAEFWRKVDRSKGLDACWPFVGAPPGRYGLTGLGRNLVGSSAAHVVAYTLAHGLSCAPDRGVDLRHLCDNKPCCNPAHLRPGTRTENLNDRFDAKRAGRAGPRLVEHPVLAPPGGWKIASGDPETLERVARTAEFWSRVDRSAGPDGCWPWTAGTRHQFGYGQMRWDGRALMPAHRIAYLIEHNLRPDHLPSETVVRHRCPPGGRPHDCCNPRHLLAGTQAENQADKKVDGTAVAGQRHHNSRASDAEIRVLREQYWAAAHGARPTLTALANEYGTSIQTVKRWLTGVSRPTAGGPTSHLVELDIY